MVRHFSRKEKARKLHSSTSILRRSISDSVERNLSCRIGLHQACREGIIDKVRALLQDQPDVNILDEDGLAPLHYATRYDRVEIVQLLIDAGADLNIISGNESKCTLPLHVAARFNSPATARLLILNEVNVSLRSEYGQHALHYAARRGNLDVVKVLLTDGKTHPNVTDNENSTPLHAASQAGKLDVVDILLEHGADPSISDNDGYTAVHLAAKDGHNDVLEKLLFTARNYGVSCSALLNKMDNEANSCLHLAVQHGHIKSADVCIQYGADTSAIQEDLTTPLHVACINSHYEMVKLLMVNGAGIHGRDAEGMTPILRASLAGNVEIIDLLLKQGADISPLESSCAPSPLMCAVKRGHHAAVKYLLERGSPIDLRDNGRRTCLHVAVYSNDMETLRIIIQAGGECLLNSKDKEDKTPLHYAATKGNLEIVQELLSAGAPLDAKDEDEQIPLHYAVKNGDLSCVRLLVEACPDSIHATDFLLQNCLHCASFCGHHLVVKYLLDQGIDVDSRDDERLTPLIQAAWSGCHTTTGVLLDRGAKIDATDKNGCTALITAASHGRVKVVKLLLDRGANMDLVVADGRHCLQSAILNGHQDVCMEITKHQRWEEAFAFKSETGFIPLRSLIETFPLVAKVVMDKCIQNSSHLITDEEYSVTYDFKYVNPDPFPRHHNNGRTYFAPKTMLDYGREDLIFHPLTIELMRIKRQRIGVRFFYASALVYMLYLANLTLYLLCAQGIHLVSQNEDGALFTGHEVCLTMRIKTWEIILSIATGIFLLIEVYQAYTEKWDYIETSNIVEVCTFTSALVAILSDQMGMDLSRKWVFLVIAILFGYLTLLLYLQSVFDAGIHVTMLFVVIKTLAKVTIMFVILLFAFALVFQLLLSKRVNASALNLVKTKELEEELSQDPFGSLELSMMKVIAMTIGEIEYTRFFTDQELFSPTLSRTVFVTFCVMMPIVLMNLTIGLAVGDIDSVQQNAEYKRLCLEIETMYEFKEKLPLWLLHRLHQAKSVRRPNRKAHTILERISGIGSKLVRRKTKYTAEDSENKVVDQLSGVVTAKMKEQDQRIHSLSEEIKEQRFLLENIHKMMCRIQANRSLSDD